jgi:hypothetical protein
MRGFNIPLYSAQSARFISLDAIDSRPFFQSAPVESIEFPTLSQVPQTV